MAMIPHGGGNATDYGICGELESHKKAMECVSAIIESCARICEQRVEREPGYNGQWEGYGSHMGLMDGEECAAEIRKQFGIGKDVKDGNGN